MSDRDAWTSLARTRGAVEPEARPHGLASDKPRDNPEERFQQAVVELAELLGWHVWHDHDSRRNRPGLPDLILFRPPRLIFAEIKVGTNRCTAEQLDWLGNVEACGVEAVEWRPDRPGRGKWSTVETAEPLGRYAMGEIERRLRRHPAQPAERRRGGEPRTGGNAPD